MKKIRIGIADDHQLFRETLTKFIGNEPDLDVRISAKNGGELIDQLKTNRVDLILLDIRMPILNGWQTLAILNQRYPKIRVIILSGYYDDSYIIKGIKLGARSFLSKDCAPGTLYDAIYTVAQDGFYFEKVSVRAMRNKLVNPELEDLRIQTEHLTSRESQIVNLICSGKTGKEIAELLCIGLRTVETHRRSIGRKIGAKNTASIVTYAIAHGIYSV